MLKHFVVSKDMKKALEYRRDKEIDPGVFWWCDTMGSAKESEYRNSLIGIKCKIHDIDEDNTK